MAFQFPKIDLADAKTRVLIIFVGLIAFVALIYFGRQFFVSKKTASGPSHLANAPGNLQSVPGGQLTPEYYRALVQANAQAAKQAQISGGSAVPTLLNEPGAQPAFEQPTAPSCTVVCPTEENVNVANDINDLVKAGKLSAEEGKKLSDLAKKSVSVSEYAANLDQLVKQGKLTPEQARKILEDYKKQHKNDLIQESGAVMDALIKSGQLPLDAANELLDLQKKQVSPAEYANKLKELVKEGKISPQTAAQLLGQYTQQHAKETAAEAAGQLEQMVASGQITPEVAKELEDYQKRQVPLKEYEEELQHLVKQGKLTPEQAQRLLTQYRQQIPPGVAKELADYQQRNVPLADYQAALQKLVATGKITPEQAQQLLEEYRQIKTAGTAEGTMSHLVKQAENANEDAVRQLAASGRISPETAQKLIELQHANVPVEEYKRQLDGMVREGKISSEDAQKLLNNYQQMQQAAGVQGLLRSGKILPETAQKLLALQKANVPVEEYKRQLDELVRTGKISPQDAQKLLSDYRQIKSGGGVQELLNTHKIPPETEQKLLAMQHANVPEEEYRRQLDQLVQAGKITPEQAKNLLTQYEKLHGVREEAGRLAAMRGNNVPVDDYVTELNRAVAAGTITPEQAAQLLQEYKATQAQQATVIPTTAPLPNVKGADEFAALQKRIQAVAPTVTTLKSITPGVPAAPEQLSAAQAKAKAIADQQEQQRLQALVGSMSQQAGQLINSWQPPVMAGQVGTEEKENPAGAAGEKAGLKGAALNTVKVHGQEEAAGPIIKAGTIIYAILDTGVNSDYPDSPVLATIVEGKYKGAKLLGKLAITQGQDRVSLTFKLMNMSLWPSSKTVNAFAIDPDTARTVLASNVNYHYFMRYGALFATSFITGYANAIGSSGATTSLSVTGSTTTNPVLSPSSKLISAFGEVGKNLGKAVQSYTTTPPTVKIDPGVSLGILFMADVAG